MTFDWWTFGLQAVNVVVLVWLLRRFFWRPVAAIIAKRSVKVQSMLADAADKQAEATAAVAEAATTREGFAAEREAILAAAHAEAAAEKAAIVQAGKDAVEAQQAMARDAMKDEVARAKTATDDAAAALGVSIARQLAARLKGPAVEAAFLDWMIEAIGAMPAPDRRAMGRGGTAVDLVSAVDLDPEAQARVSAALEPALGGKPVLTFRTDPALIAGYELHSPHYTLRNSWQADLEQISAQLRADPKSGTLTNAT